MAWMTIVGFVIVVLLFIAVYVFLGPLVGNLILFLSLLGTAIWWLYQRAVVHLNEMEFGVIFTRDDNFSHFLDSGQHYINPFTQRLDAKISKGSQSAHGRTEKVRTKEGIPVTVTWDVSAKIDVDDINPNIKHKMARALPKYASNIVGGKAVHALRHLIEQKKIEELHGEDSIKKLEEELRHDVYRRCKALGFQELSPSDVKLGPIEAPPSVEKALEKAYARRLETKITVEALAQLQAAIEEMDDVVMERLHDLERLRIVDRVDTQFYMMDTGGARGGGSSGGGGRPRRPANSAGPQPPGPPSSPGSEPI
jgi:hypothetical protein